MNNHTWYYSLEKRFRRIAIPNMMTYIVIVMAIVYVGDLIVSAADPSLSVSSWLYFDRDLVFQGQVWRCITFIFLPPSTSLLFVIFALYFEVILARGLEAQWGSSRFMLFYLTGMILSLIGGFISGFTTNTYLHASMFFAFALFYPDFELLIFFILPVKIKYLAIIDAILYVLLFVFSSWSDRLAMIISLANVALFFWQDIRWHWQRLRQNARIRKMQQQSRDRYR